MAALGIDAEVLRNELASVAEEMALIVRRTARSTAARESGDYSTALLRRDGALLAQGMAHGIHIGSMAAIMPGILAKFGERGFRSGDIVMSNDPYAGLSHLPDIVLVAPVIEAGGVAGFVAVEMHHSDIGGRFAGGMGAQSHSIYEEGIRLPTLLLHDAGTVNVELLDLIRANVRDPEIVLGDLQAQVSSIAHGLRHFETIIGKYGLPRLDELTGQLFEYDAVAMRNLIASMTPGTYEAEDLFEGDGRLDGSSGYRIRARLDVNADKLSFDFNGTDHQSARAINCPEGLTRAATQAVVRGFVGEGVNVTGALFEAVELHCPLGTLVNPAFPGAVAARGALLWRVVDVLTTLMSRAGAHPGMTNGDGGVSALVFESDRGERNWPVLLDLYAGGWGARSDSDGIDGTSSLISGGMLRTIPAEVMELEYPVVLRDNSLVPDTSGAGRFRGTLALAREWEFEADGICEIRVCRRETRPQGEAGGLPGSHAQLEWWRGGEQLELPTGLQPVLHIRAGDRLRHVQPGGGGWGDPAERDREAVRLEIREGKLTPAYAARVYGAPVELDPLAGA